MSLTAAQQSAVTARGNVLVVAGAGTGKTSTLVERCLSCLLDEKPRAALDEILMVTFTDAAAAEMRQRIRARLETEIEARRGKPAEGSAVRHLQEQLALFEAAHIGTLHSFCLQLVRQHFYELELDPQLTVLAEEESRLLASETLEAVLQKHYAGRGNSAERVQRLIEAQGRGWDQPVRQLVLRLHHYMQTRPDSTGWLAAQRGMFEAPEPTDWKRWLKEAIGGWAEESMPFLEKLRKTNDIAASCVDLLMEIERKKLAGDPDWRAKAAACLETIGERKKNPPYGKKGAWVTPLEPFFEEADFLSTLVSLEGTRDPLADDWKWVREQMLTLLELVREFTESFSEAKRELGSVDFHDLEQYSLRLLWDRESGQLTPIAQEWRRRLRFVFVDEYQDINAAQDRIIQGLSREGAQSNRFLVGDVKQSIYRFRLAEPRIFQSYAEAWRRGKAQVIPLVENFRSREGILKFVNSVFELVMHRETGGVEYDEEAQLRFGGSAEAPGPQSEPWVELHLRLKPANPAAQKETGGEGAPDQIGELEEAAKEARIVASRLKRLVTSQHQIWDASEERYRAVKWSDMAVLLRSPSTKAESYAKEFSRLNVPLQVSRGGFYDSLEISDLLNLLKILDNPLQDLPLLAVLHSPLAGLSANELSLVRLAAPGPFWTALVRFNEGVEPVADRAGKVEAAGGEALRKAGIFLEQFARWRKLARQASLSQCLEKVLAETHHNEWLLTQDRGEQRQANVRRLLALARQFDEFQRQGLFRFLRFIEAQQSADTEPEVAPVAEDNAVRLMSIHQSKGLEFPVVVVADLGKTFNDADLRADVILDEQYGLCPQVKPPDVDARYPSLPYWLARRRQRREMLGEELRLLYVAMTRARDLLILSGATTEAKFERDWRADVGEGNPDIAAARAYGDWLAAWFSRNASCAGEARHGENAFLRWTIYRDADLPGAGEEPGMAKAGVTRIDIGAKDWGALAKRLAWSYPFVAATEQPAKTSVTALRHQLAEQRDDAASRFLEPGGVVPLKAGAKQRARQVAWSDAASAVDVGRVHHTFLELLMLERAGSVTSLQQEAKRLEKEGVLTTEECARLDVEAVAGFWRSEIGTKIREQTSNVRRELAFTARFPAAELAGLATEPPAASLEGEFVVVQGVADLVVILKKEIWLVDFKTDAVKGGAVAEKVRSYEPQLKLYARALSEIYQRPVSQCWLYFLSAQAAVPIQLA